jgi:hypothetical protein
MSAAGPPQERLQERGEAKARSARPRVLAAADAWLLHFADPCQEAERNYAAAVLANEAASVGVVS